MNGFMNVSSKAFQSLGLNHGLPAQGRPTVYFSAAQPAEDVFLVNRAPVTKATGSSLQAYGQILDDAAPLAQPKVSNFQARAVAVGQSGKGYVGVNVELPMGSYADTIHAEQFALILARIRGEKGVRHMVASASPCGHCRQFMLEIGEPKLGVLYYQPKTQSWHDTGIQTLLPDGFTLSQPDQNMYLRGNKLPIVLKDTQKASDKLVDLALEAAKDAYVPVSTNTWAGLALELKDGTTATGTVVESSAYNPTVTPLQYAVVDLVSRHLEFKEIEHAVLVMPESANFSYLPAIRNFLQVYAPEASLEVVLGKTK